MKIFKIVLVSMTLFIGAFALSSCGGGDHSHDNTGMEYTAAYICPMHCEGSGSDEAGTCPVCNMDYVANEDQQGDDHDHGHDDHDSHDH